MFAGPKPEVVADHVETLLKIGLGPHGKVRYPNFGVRPRELTRVPHQVDLILAKYTCIALSRVAGSVKKVKGESLISRSDKQRVGSTPSSTGSLDDVSVRLPMDSPVFARLAGVIQHPSSNKEWSVRIAVLAKDILADLELFKY